MLWSGKEHDILTLNETYPINSLKHIQNKSNNVIGYLMTVYNMCKSSVPNSLNLNEEKIITMDSLKLNIMYTDLIPSLIENIEGNNKEIENKESLITNELINFLVIDNDICYNEAFNIIKKLDEVKPKD